MLWLGDHVRELVEGTNFYLCIYYLMNTAQVTFQDATRDESFEAKHQ